MAINRNLSILAQGASSTGNLLNYTGAEVLDADGNPLPYSDEALAALEVK